MKPVKKFCDLIEAGVLEIGDGYRAKIEELGGDGPVFLRAVFLQDQGFTISSPDRFKNKDLLNFGPKIAKLGDVVITTKGNSTGRVGFADYSVLGAVYSPHLSYWRSLNPNVINHRFLYYWSRSADFVEQLQGMAYSTDMAPYFSLRDQRQLSIKLPIPEQQQAIADILGSLDDKIELNRKINATLEGMAQAIFRDWFVDFGPPRRKQEGADDPVQIMGGLVQDPARAQPLADLFPAVIGDDGLPEGWSLLPIDEIASRVAMGPFGSRITKDNFVSDGVPVIRGQNLKNGFLDDNFVFLTEEKAEELSSAAAKSQSIVFTHRGTLGQVGRIPIETNYPRYIVSQSQMLLDVDDAKVSSRLVYYFFKSDMGQDALLAHTNTTGVPSLARPSTSLKSIRLTVPTVSISDALDCYLDPFERQSLANLRQNSTLAGLRDLLLPKLMSGEIRLSDAEKAVEDAA